MADISSVLGTHAGSLTVQQQRMAVLASNLANADTPGYKARDIDFAKVLAGEQKQAAAGTVALAATSPLHATGASAVGGGLPTVYRVPLQPTLDGNTVDEQVEQAAYADAALHYQASLSFLNGDVKGLLTAITGQ